MRSQGRPEEGREAQGQASPRGCESITVRWGDCGQIGERPVMRTDQRVGTVMTGTEEAEVVGCWRR